MTRDEYVARALSPFVWDPNSAQAAQEPHAVKAQKARSLRRAQRMIQANDEWEFRFGAGQNGK